MIIICNRTVWHRNFSTHLSYLTRRWGIPKDSLYLPCLVSVNSANCLIMSSIVSTQYPSVADTAREHMSCAGKTDKRHEMRSQIFSCMFLKDFKRKSHNSVSPLTGSVNIYDFRRPSWGYRRYMWYIRPAVEVKHDANSGTFSHLQIVLRSQKLHY